MGLTTGRDMGAIVCFSSSSWCCVVAADVTLLFHRPAILSEGGEEVNALLLLHPLDDDRDTSLNEPSIVSCGVGGQGSRMDIPAALG